MPRYCVVQNCQTKANEGITLFLFANDSHQRQKWLNVSNLNEDDITGVACVCELHFTPDQILTTGQKKRLKLGAVPTIFLKHEESPTSSGSVLSSAAGAGSLSVVSTPKDSIIFSNPSTNSGSLSSDYQPGSKRFRFSNECSSNYLESNNKRTFLVQEEHLRKLFRFCFECGTRLTDAAKFFAEGAHLRVTWFCCKCDTNRSWTNFSMCFGMSEANILIPAAVILAGKTYEDLFHISDSLQLQVTSKNTYYDVAKSYVYPSIDFVHANENQQILAEIASMQHSGVNPGLIIAMDSRFSRPGFTATYATTSAMDLKSEKIIASVTTMKTVDAPYSQNLELEGTKTILNALVNPSLSQSGVDKPKFDLHTLVTDDHKMIIKMMKADYPDVRHEGDVWHFVKRIKKRLSTLSDKKETKDLGLWIKSISNFVWTICQLCEGDEEQLVDLWRSILHHVSNHHTWNDDPKFSTVKKCLHPEYSEEQVKTTAWLKRGSKSFKALETVINDKQFLSSLQRCSRFLQTSKLESFHSCILRFAPKRLSFGWDGYNSRIHLAILHFNENIGRAVATNELGEMRTRSVVPLATGEWTMKVLLQKQTHKWRKVILEQIFDQRREKAAQRGHNLRERQVIMAPTLVSAIPKESPNVLLANLRKRRHMDD